MKASEHDPVERSHQGPYCGQFGGRYVPGGPDHGALDELERVYTEAKADPEFHKEFATLQPAVTWDARPR